MAMKLEPMLEKLRQTFCGEITLMLSRNEVIRVIAVTCLPPCWQVGCIVQRKMALISLVTT